MTSEDQLEPIEEAAEEEDDCDACLNQIQSNIKDDLKSAIDEWDHVACVIPTLSVTSNLGQTTHLITPEVGFEECVRYFRQSCLINNEDNSALGEHNPNLVSRSWSGRLMSLFFGPKTLNSQLRKDRDLICKIAKIQMDNSCELHLRMLQTIYKRLTLSRFDCPRFGGHWEEIGFQGTDPATDLRGCGMLALLNQLYFLVKNEPSYKVALDIYTFSRQPEHEFPYLLMSINISKLVLDSLKKDCLNSECNSKCNVVEVTSDLFVALMVEFHEIILRREYVSVLQSGTILKKLESMSRKRPHQLIRKLSREIKDKKKDGGGSRRASAVCCVPTRADRSFDDLGAASADDGEEDIG